MITNTDSQKRKWLHWQIWISLKKQSFFTPREESLEFSFTVDSLVFFCPLFCKVLSSHPHFPPSPCHSHPLFWVQGLQTVMSTFQVWLCRWSAWHRAWWVKPCRLLLPPPSLQLPPPQPPVQALPPPPRPPPSAPTSAWPLHCPVAPRPCWPFAVNSTPPCLLLTLLLVGTGVFVSLSPLLCTPVWKVFCPGLDLSVDRSPSVSLACILKSVDHYPVEWNCT